MPEPDNETKTCPYCAETIKLQAMICRFCNRDLTDGSVVGRQRQGSGHANHRPAEEVQARSGVADGVKLGCGMFIVLPILLILGGILFVILSAVILPR